MSLTLLLKAGESLFATDGQYVRDAGGYAAKCVEDTEVTFTHQWHYDNALAVTRANRVLANRDPDTGLPLE
jgi:hypothetical protein